MMESLRSLEGDGGEIDPWVLEFDDYDPSQELLREALCVLGNGRYATRGAAPECPAVDQTHYPGTYAAGLYNSLTDEVEGREIENESLVNLPNWLPLTFRIEDGEWYSIDDVEIESFHQALLMDRGTLTRDVRFADASGRVTSVSQRRLVHMGRPSLAALETTIQPENWEGRMTIRSVLDGGVRNRNVARYRQLSDRHLAVLERHTEHGQIHCLRTRTTQSRVEVVTGARQRTWLDAEPYTPEKRTIEDDDLVGEELVLDVRCGSRFRVEKVVSIATSKDMAISEPRVAVVDELADAPDFEKLEEENAASWRDLWGRFKVGMDGPPEVHRATNFHIFHLLQVASPNVIDVDAGIPARGLHGEAYRGHVFWDELFVFPVIHVRAPLIARSLLLYRHRRLPAARRAAENAGYEGAMFPWQSGSDGSEETQEVHLNPRSGNWNPDLSRRQHHVNLAIAYNVIQYVRFTRDREFLVGPGAEMLIEIARFWASIATHDRSADRYDIVGVVGPDEFHDDDPNWTEPGLRNNAYTNVMTSWLLSSVAEVLDSLSHRERRALFDRHGVDGNELERWNEISRKLKVPMHEGVISQFEGYEQLAEFDWEGYGRRYESIERLDRILEAEGDSVNNYKASKQADVLMLFYLLSFEELVRVFMRLGIDFDEEMLSRNIDYYMTRTSHGSTLSRLVHSWVVARSDRSKSMELFRHALQSDLNDTQGGTTKEGVHLGAMAGTVDLLQRGYSGMEAGSDAVLRFKPNLDPEIRRLDFSIYYQQRWLDVSVVGEDVTVSSEVTSQAPIRVECRGHETDVGSGETREFRRD